MQNMSEAETREDQALMREAMKRLKRGGKTVPMEKVMQELGITAEELEDADEVEIE